MKKCYNLQFRGSIELSSSTKCNIARRGTYSFPFYLNTERGTHLFKVKKKKRKKGCETFTSPVLMEGHQHRTVKITSNFGHLVEGTI